MVYKRYNPQQYDEFVGQTDIIKELVVQTNASKIKNKALEHILLYGAPGLGKSTLARIIAKERGTNLMEVTGTSISSISQLEWRLFSLKEQDVLFIDEIHNLPTKLCELLYTPLESFVYNDIPVFPFTLIAATNYAGQIDKPLRDRITHKFIVEDYTEEEICQVLRLNGAPPEIAKVISERSRGTPRVARDLLRKIDNRRIHMGNNALTLQNCLDEFDSLGIDPIGLTSKDTEFLAYLKDNGAFDISRAIGEKTLCISLDIDKYDLTVLMEPYLLRKGLIQRTSRGRVLTREGIQYLTRR